MEEAMLEVSPKPEQRLPKYKPIRLDPRNRTVLDLGKCGGTCFEKPIMRGADFRDDI